MGSQNIHDHGGGGVPNQGIRGAKWGEFSSLDEAEEAYLLFLGKEPAMVPEKPQKRPLLGLNIGNLLKEACNELQIPHPIYRNISKKFRDGRIIHCHLASIVPPGSCKALVQCSRFSLNPQASMEDAARLCLRTLSKNLQRPVCDYNFDLLLDLHKKHIEMEEDYKGLESKIRSISNNTSNNEEKVFDLEKIDQTGKGLPPSSSHGSVA
ncbi:hypothetical protein PIB30_024173 [Stylosanthes scabra]|uniref:Uncharacterized protein n=1 Tax=Stylosanthes scabra TaxID=79078 RepID=A0ABU6Y6T8_9FABA|nr:hypothetical protein [Stylosanthes scabra]